MLWLVIEPTSFVLYPPQGWMRNWNSGGPDDAKLLGETAYVPGHAVKPDDGFTWTVKFFWQEPSRVDYSVRVYAGPTWKAVQADPSLLLLAPEFSAPVKDYGERFTTIKIC
jgi:hypothetical protein